MKIHEYQAKELMRSGGIPVPEGVPVTTAEEAVAAGAQLVGATDNAVVVVKSKIHAGGRGKGRRKRPGAGRMRRGPHLVRDEAPETGIVVRHRVGTLQQPVNRPDNLVRMFSQVDQTSHGNQCVSRLRRSDRVRERPDFLFCDIGTGRDHVLLPNLLLRFPDELRDQDQRIVYIAQARTGPAHDFANGRVFYRLV